MAKKNMDEGGGNWMDTYGDMVTLLLTFFVMLYSMSSVNEDKWAALVRAFNIHGEESVDQFVVIYSDIEEGSSPLQNTQSGNAIENDDAPDTIEELNDLFINIERYVEEHNMTENIDVVQGEEVTDTQNPDESSHKGERSRNIYIQFKNDVLFMPDEATLKGDANDIIKFLGECLKSVEPNIAMIIIKGHTAISPTSVVDSRLLSSERAGTISNILEKSHKIPSTKLYPIGLSGDYPIADNDTEEGRAQNRRVEIVIIGSDSDLAKSGELLKILGASFDTGTAEIEDLSEN